VPHRAESEKDKGVLIDSTVHRERTMASFWSNVWAGRAFFFGCVMPSGVESHVGWPNRREVFS
jgi:hypothetical protein